MRLKNQLFFLNQDVLKGGWFFGAGSYTVRPIKFGFEINIASSTPGNYDGNIYEAGRPETTVHLSTQNSQLIFNNLKPCTEYEHTVTLTKSDKNKTTCSCTEMKHTTNQISE